jgi:galactonate dehydratase
VKLDSVKVFVVANPPPSFGGRYFVFLKLKTACGIEGVGEVYAATFGPKVITGMIEDSVRAAASRARSVSHRGVLARELRLRLHAAAGSHAHGRHQRTGDGVLGHHGQGRGTTDLQFARRQGARAPAQLHLSVPRPRRRRRFLSRCRAFRGARRGVRGAGLLRAEVRSHRRLVQLRPAAADPGGARAHRAAGAPGARGRRARAPIFCSGTHGQFTTAGAIRLARQLEPYDPLWFEEPVPPEMPEQMAIVARGTSIPIATGERLTTKYEFARVLACGAANILQLNLGRVGGILEAKKVAALAEVHYAQIAPHLYCGPVVGAANIQIAACSPNFLLLEGIQQWGGFHSQILKQPIRWEQGYVIPPTAPGLGVELDEAVALAHPYDPQGRCIWKW